MGSKRRSNRNTSKDEQYEIEDVLSLLNDIGGYGTFNNETDAVMLKKMITKQNKKKKILNAGYKYWWSESKQKFLCHVYKNGKRTLVQRKSEDEMIEFLLGLLDMQEVPDVTFKEAYIKWQNFQHNFVTDNTVRKYQTDWIRYFADTPFEDSIIRDMSENDIRVFIVNKVKELTIGKEATKGFVNSIKRVLEHMVKEGFLEFNPAGDIEPKDFFKYSTERVRPREKVVVNDVRWDLIEEMLDETIRLKPYYACVPLAVKFARRTGMRVAEIAALRWDHVYEDHFHIDSSEKTSRLTNEVWIGPTKNTDVRDFPITEEIQEILDQCKFYSERFDLDREWVFVDVSGRIHSSVISSCLRNKCRQLQRRGNDVPEIGIHCLRRTLNSKMHNQGVCTVTAATLLGHSEDVNRHYYTFDVTDNEEKRRIVSDVLKNR